MSREIHLNQVDDRTGAIQLAVAQLEAGQLIVLPDESGWNLAGLASRASAAVPLAKLSSSESLGFEAVSVTHPEVVVDYVSDLSPLFRKLSARSWPGPVILRTGSGRVEGFAGQWPLEAQAWGLTPAGRAFYCPADHFARSVLEDVSAPALSLIGSATNPIPERIRKQASVVVYPAEVRFSEPPTVANVAEGRLRIERSGVVSERMLARLAGEVYLFVCTGNTCRSPMAEALFRKMLADRLSCREDELLDYGFTVISAGLAAHHGSAASPEAVNLLHEQGVDLSGHESQPITEELLSHSDHILTMTRSHRDAVISAYPELAQQVRLLSPQGQDVPDPIGAGIEEYVRCRDEITEHLRHLLGEIDFSTKHPARGPC